MAKSHGLIAEKQTLVMDFHPQALQLTVWNSATINKKGFIAAIHGLTTHGMKAFHYLGPYLAQKGWTTLAIDLPGFGHWNDQGHMGEKQHWAMGCVAMSKFVKLCNTYVNFHEEKIILLGSSLGGAICLKYLMDHVNDNENLIDGMVLLAPLVDFKLPLILYLILSLVLAVNPEKRVKIAQFDSKGKSHDCNSIIFKEDPFQLTDISLGYFFEAFKCIKSMKKWYTTPWLEDLPTCVISAGLDTLVNPVHIKQFFMKLPAVNYSQHIHYENAYHYLLYENIRDDLFDKIEQFLTKIPKRRIKNE